MKKPPGFRRRNKIAGQFAPRLIEMLESPAYRVLSVSAHRSGTTTISAIGSGIRYIK